MGKSRVNLNSLNRAHNTKPTMADLESHLRLCGHFKDLSLGRSVHAHIVESEHHPNQFLANLVVQMYGKCHALKDAQSVFSVMPCKDIYAWTFMIGAYAAVGQSKSALQVFQQMQKDHVKPNVHTFIYLLSACTVKNAINGGRLIHNIILSSGFEHYNVISTALVCMYSKCGNLDDAYHVADSTPEKDIVAWNANIEMSAAQGLEKEAFVFLHKIQAEGLIPTTATFLSILNACTTNPKLQSVRRLHAIIICSESHFDISVVNALLNVYGKCGSVEDACNTFQRMNVHNVISWTALITVFAEYGWSKDVVQLLKQMQREGLNPDSAAFACSLSSCFNELSLLQGMWIHSRIIHCGLEPDLVVGTALVTMYGRCGDVKSARRVFESLPQRDAVCWNAMISVYSQHGFREEALQLLRNMEILDFVPSKITLIIILDACGNESALSEGQRIHAWLMQYQFDSETIIVNALMDMYGKCGCLEDSRKMFDKMPVKNVVSWTAIVAAYGQQGLGRNALLLFDRMRDEGLMPNEITFVNLIAACSYAGMVEEAWQIFTSIQQEYHIIFTTEHYDCMIDVLCRSGQLSQGKVMIENMPFQPNATAWMSFITACKLHCETKEAVDSALHVFEVDGYNAPLYVLLSNISSIGIDYDGDIAIT